MKDNPLNVVARIKAKPESVAAVRELLRGLIRPTRSEPGCLKYELLQDRADPTDFTFVEEWSGEAAFEAHRSSAHIRSTTPRLKALLVEAPDIRACAVVEGE